MLQIRKEQMEVLNAYMHERYIEKMLAHLREVFPDEVKDKKEEDLRAFIEDGIKRAAAYDITAEREVALYTDLMMGMGVDFEKKKENKSTLTILKRADLNQREKMDIIYARLRR